jgi:hypothetical protein
MMERDLDSLYDLLLATPENTDFESDSEGSCPLLRECNMLRLSKDGAAPAKDVEDDAYLIPCTPREQAEYDQEHLERARVREADQVDAHRDHRCTSPQHLDTKGAWT